MCVDHRGYLTKYLLVPAATAEERERERENADGTMLPTSSHSLIGTEEKEVRIYGEYMHYSTMNVSMVSIEVDGLKKKAEEDERRTWCRK